MRWGLAAITLAFLFTACTSNPKQTAQSKTSSAKKLGIRPHGDETIQPDLSKTPEDLKKVFAYIDEHIDDHVENLQKWIRQPSISNTGEGIPESAEMVKGFFDRAAGSARRRGFMTSVSPSTARRETPWSTPSGDEGAPRTLAVYWMYDTMPITQTDAWKNPPFEAQAGGAGAVQESS